MNELLGKHTVFLDWLQKKISERQFFIVSSILVGLTAGLAAVILKLLVHYIHDAITYDYNFPFQYYLYLIFPMLGLLASVFYVQRFNKGTLEKSTSFVLYSISKKSSLLAPFHMWAHVLTSAITMGLGGSSGLEAPIAVTGSAIGSNYSRTYKLNYRQRTLLLSCGAAAGIAAAFNAPIAGVLFSIEVLILDITATAFIPLIVSAAMGALCSNIILNEGILLSFKTQQTFNFENIPLYIGLAITCGIVSIYHSVTFLKLDLWFENFKHPYLRAIIGGWILSLLIFLFPPLFGEGYNSVISLSQLNPEILLQNSVLGDLSRNEWLVVLFLGAIVFAKAIATAATLSGGGNGGNFAPSLMVGAFWGFFFARVVNLTGLAKVPESNFTLVAMAGIMSGVMHAPLTAIFLIAEVTGGYGLMIPLMVVASLSYLIVRFIEPNSIDSIKLARKGEELIHDRDKRILKSIALSHLVESNFQPINQNAMLRELIPLIEISRRNVFPVLDDDKKLVGIIQLDNIREIMFHQEMYDNIVVKELMRRPPALIESSESMDAAMEKFDKTEAWNLPVVDKGVYVGFISKSSIFSKYRSELIERSVQ